MLPLGAPIRITAPLLAGSSRLGVDELRHVETECALHIGVRCHGHGHGAAEPIQMLVQRLHSQTLAAALPSVFIQEMALSQAHAKEVPARAPQHMIVIALLVVGGTHAQSAEMRSARITGERSASVEVHKLLPTARTAIQAFASEHMALCLEDSVAHGAVVRAFAQA